MERYDPDPIERRPLGDVLQAIKLPTVQESAARLARAQRQRAEQRIAALRANWGAPLRHVQQTVFAADNPWFEKYSGLTARLRTGHGVMAALVGTRGNGKTQMAVELMRDTTARFKSARFTTAVGFFMRVKATYRDKATATEETVLNEFEKPHLLVIDEFEKRADSVWENNLLFELLNRRYNALRDTVLIANASVDKFPEYLGPSLMSRINETGGVLDCTWASFRG